MRYIETIENVTKEILSDQIDYAALKNKLEDFKSTLLELTRLDLEKQSNKKDIHFDNGISLSPTFAALCTDDIMRTRQFIRGIFEAVKQVHFDKKNPIRIFYAGTGPFATLILPVLTKYSSEELQLVLFEVNKQTTIYLKRLIKQLSIEHYIEKIICEDASKYKLEKETKADILISETTQYGLVKEQQVSIMLNLMSQLNEDVIIIPNKVQLDLALMNTRTKYILQNLSESKYKVLSTLLEFDKGFIQSYLKQVKYPKQNGRFELCKRLPFMEEIDAYDKLVILTTIQVYGKEWIEVDLSGLTIPKVLMDLDRVKKGIREISIDYVIKNIPDFEYELN